MIALYESKLKEIADTAIELGFSTIDGLNKVYKFGRDVVDYSGVAGRAAALKPKEKLAIETKQPGWGNIEEQVNLSRNMTVMGSLIEGCIYTGLYSHIKDFPWDSTPPLTKIIGAAALARYAHYRHEKRKREKKLKEEQMNNDLTDNL